MTVVCSDIGNRREIGHRKDQEISGIMDRSKSLMTNPAIWKFTPLNYETWEIWMRVLPFQANPRVKRRKRRRKVFMFS